MARVDLTVTERAALPENGQLLAPVSSNTTDQHQVTNDGTVLVEVACVNARTVRFTFTSKGDTVQKDVALTAGQRRVFGPFPAAPFNEHAAAADPTKLYIDQVSGSNGDLTYSAFRAPAR